ncbi:MAG: hypothetical protein LPJ92_16730 [Rhodobacterales bacterium]|nr:hypothetical protein [Rhodobacterales bacterium]MDX5391988.1 hypothetical protein [Rhodobacterales bacterium]MDX5491679.1 hypothetical protein [Rhodobacterales bacterium]
MTGKFPRGTRWGLFSIFLSRSLSDLLSQLAPPRLQPIRITEMAVPRARTINGRHAAKGTVRR